MANLLKPDRFLADWAIDRKINNLRTYDLPWSVFRGALAERWFTPDAHRYTNCLLTVLTKHEPGAEYTPLEQRVRPLNLLLNGWESYEPSPRGSCGTGPQGAIRNMMNSGSVPTTLPPSRSRIGGPKRRICASQNCNGLSRVP